MTAQLPRLHAVTNDSVLRLPDFLPRVASIVSVPGVAIHIRSGSAGGRGLSEIADSAIRSCPAGCNVVFVNDRVDIARVVGAAGVHLPAAGLSVTHARSIVGPDVWVGRSTHSASEVKRAADDGADYVFLGPIWHTASHPNRPPLGPDILAVTDNIHVFAIGGVTAERVPTCLDAGAYGVAVISALWYATDVSSTAHRLSLSFQS